MHESSRPGRRRGHGWAAGIALVVCSMLLGCSPRVIGPAFEAAPAPAPDRARLYVYRADPRPSLSPVRLQIDGRMLGVLHDGEYETIELPPGFHEIEAGVRSVAFVAWGWNDQRLHLEPGETAYLKVSVRLVPRAQPASRAADIAGRPSGAASENVYLEPRGASEASSELADTTRRVPEVGSGASRKP